MRSNTEMLEELRTMLGDVFALRHAGATYSRMARAHGYVDGYMRALLETGQVDRNELLAMVASERERVSGPATKTTTILQPAEEVAA